MGIISRFVDIMSANINALLDKSEDPAKMIDQYLLQLTEELAEVRSETAGIMAEETHAKRLLDENEEQIAKYDDLSRKALKAGNEDDARVFITKKQRYESDLADAQETYDIASDNARKMRQMHDKLVDDIEELKSRRQSVKAKVAVAKAQDRVNKINDAVGNASGTIGAFERMEEKADRMLDKVNAMNELNRTDAEKDLEEKYKKSSSASVDDELSALKAEMGIE